jgi:SAM-dependent methyltransferase
MPFDPEAVREFERTGWNRAAATYAATFAAASRQFIEPLLDAPGLDAAGVVRGTAVLDLCCGPGFVAAAAHARGAIATGLDFSPAMLAEARSRYPAIAFDHGDAEAPPYDDASFDAVVSNFGIHHVPRPCVALNEVHRILRNGGQFAFSIWSGRDENIAWKLVFDAVERHGDPRASAAPPPGGGFASPADCLRALDAAGFEPRTATLVRGVWRHADAASLVAAFRGGTARMAAMLEAQAESAMPAILAGLEAAAASWRDKDGQLAVPIACVIAAGIKR